MKDNQHGQSTIEFILCFTFGVGIILMVFSQAMNYASGYLVHYATFMSSRHFLTMESYSGTYGAGGMGNAADDAKSVYAGYQLGNFGVNAELQINSPEQSGPNQYLVVGGWVQYDKQIDVLGKVTGQQTVNLISEAFLGKEPTRGVCAARTCYAITGQESCAPDYDITLYDDGC